MFYFQLNDGLDRRRRSADRETLYGASSEGELRQNQRRRRENQHHSHIHHEKRRSRRSTSRELELEEEQQQQQHRQQRRQQQQQQQQESEDSPTVILQLEDEEAEAEAEEILRDFDDFPSGFDSHRGRRSKRSATNEVRASNRKKPQFQDEEDGEEGSGIRIVKEISFGDQVGKNTEKCEKSNDHLW